MDHHLSSTGPTGRRRPPSHIEIPVSYNMTSDPPNLKRRSRPVIPLRTEPLKAPSVRISAVPAPTRKPTAKVEPKVEPRASSGSLFSLFSRPKVERARGHHEQNFEIPELAPQPKDFSRQTIAPPSPIVRVSPMNPPSPVVRIIPGSTPIRPRDEPSGVSFRAHMTSRTTSFRNRPSDAWEPPALAGAYPNAIKDGVVRTTTQNPDSLYRANSQKAKGDGSNRLSTFEPTASTDQEGSHGKELRNRLNKSRRRFSTQSLTPELTRKIFVLTPQYFLQYAENGMSNRLPEKVLKLGKDSAAYACDLIPGQPYVLQVSQAANDDGTLATNHHRSLRSRLHIQSAAAKRVATSFVLVFENASDMDCWLMAIKKEIEELGGKRVRSETPNLDRQDSLNERPQSSMGNRDPIKRSSLRMSTTLPSIKNSPLIITSEYDKMDGHAASQRQHPGQSFENEAGQHHQPDRSRLSYISNATSATVPSVVSRGSSPVPPSPRSEDHSSDTEPEIHQAASHSSAYVSSMTNKRRSLHTLPPTAEDETTSSTGAEAKPVPGLGLSTNIRSQSPNDENHVSSPHARNFSRPSAPHRTTPTRSSSAPPAKFLAQSPVKETGKRQSTRPQSTIGTLPDFNNRPTVRAVSTNRLSFRPVPIRTPGSNEPRRDSFGVAPQRSSIISPNTPSGDSTSGSSRPESFSTTVSNASSATAMTASPSTNHIISQTITMPGADTSKDSPKSPSTPTSHILTQMAPNNSSPPNLQTTAPQPARSINNSQAKGPSPPAAKRVSVMIPNTSPPPAGPLPPTPQTPSLRRPTSMQIRSSPAAFLATSRPNRSTSGSSTSPQGPSPTDPTPKPRPTPSLSPFPSTTRTTTLPNISAPRAPLRSSTSRESFLANPANFQAGIVLGGGMSRPPTQPVRPVSAAPQGTRRMSGQLMPLKLQARRSISPAGLPPPAPPPSVPLPAPPPASSGAGAR